MFNNNFDKIKNCHFLEHLYYNSIQYVVKYISFVSPDEESN